MRSSRWVFNPTRCKTLMNTILDKCATELPDNEEGGSIADDCVRFRMTVETTEIPRCYGNYDRPSYYRTMSLVDAEASINQFCSKNRVLDSEVVSPPAFCQDCDDVAPIKSYTRGDTVLQISVAFDREREGCGEPKKFRLAQDANECKRVLLEPINGCDTGSTSAKWGGDIPQTNSENGCVKWTVWAYERGAEANLPPGKRGLQLVSQPFKA
ncbi:hypothetical protein BDZ85DRAFT_77901 [Elsinoe ampelina]|uniref:Uncharacterized protein n=1 Tax=Elsinoe ampelina TaxID=302913 RepID=A0A6A6FYX6_9PEZI|nr:hypothetical protein BDZ85DRAFT_77901 [Elsinoe ampelina]